MRVIVAGSRTITDKRLVLDAIEESGFEVTEVISGCAGGVDSCALMKPWACLVTKMPTDWKRGKRAGFYRNEAMIERADALVAVWDGVSRGTEHTIFLARGARLKVFVEAVCQ